MSAVSRRRRGVRRARATVVGVVILVTVVLLGPGGSQPAAIAQSPGAIQSAATPNAAPTALTVDADLPGRVIPAGFLGLSFEYWALENYAGRNPRAVNPVLLALIRQLVKPGSAVVRIGGVTTDQTWWPVPGMSHPPGARYSLTTRRLEVARTLARKVGARLIMGVNFEADSRELAAAETQAMLRVIGRNRIYAFELGNEPELYGSRPWYWTKSGQEAFGRTGEWYFTALNADYARVAPALGPVALAGPTIGAGSWMADLAPFLASEPRIRVVTLHRYPLQNCSVGPGSPNYPTITHLLSQTASQGLAESLAPYVVLAHAAHLPVRSDEMNTVSCGYSHGVSNVFGSALWSLDALFEMAAQGVDGVNIHSYSGAGDQLFSFTRSGKHWRGLVAPEYYGLLMFAQAAPRGARLLPITGGTGTLRAWATVSPRGVVHVLLINDDPARAQTVSLRIAGGSGTASVKRLLAPNVRATRHVSLGGQSFAAHTGTGRLTGRPADTILHAVDGRYVLPVRAASADLLTLS
jgi:hypothetical protein